jgi:predicted kinase
MQPKLILLNGFAGSGKSTIARQYITDHPLALAVEGDELIVNMGQWLANEDEARALTYELIQTMVHTHLSAGHDVVLPYLVVDHTHVAAFQAIAKKCSADFYSFLLHNEKKTAIAKLLERGSWGEAGTDPLSEKDMPVIHQIYDQMEAQLEHQKDSIVIPQQGSSIDQTYETLLKHLESASK